MAAHVVTATAFAPLATLVAFACLAVPTAGSDGRNDSSANSRRRRFRHAASASASYAAASSSAAACDARDPCRCMLPREGPGEDGAYGGCAAHQRRSAASLCFVVDPLECSLSNATASQRSVSFRGQRWRPCDAAAEEECERHRLLRRHRALIQACAQERCAPQLRACGGGGGGGDPGKPAKPTERCSLRQPAASAAAAAAAAVAATLEATAPAAVPPAAAESAAATSGDAHRDAYAALQRCLLRTCTHLGQPSEGRRQRARAAVDGKQKGAQGRGGRRPAVAGSRAAPEEEVRHRMVAGSGAAATARMAALNAQQEAALQRALARVKGGEEATTVLLSMKDQLATTPGAQPSLGVVEAAGRRFIREAELPRNQRKQLTQMIDEYVLMQTVLQ